MLLHETKIRLSKAILLKDAFTGEPVSADIRIRSLSGGRLEKKGKGYYLFLDVSGKEIEMEAESFIYQRRRLILQADNGEEPEEILMYPSLAYPIRSDCTAVRGCIGTESILWFHFEDESMGCRLLSDYKKGEAKLSFYVKNRGFGIFWHVKKKQKKEGEYFSLKGYQADSEIYELEKPLQCAYQKKDSVIYPAWGTVSDENGTFYLLLKDLPGEKCLLHYCYKDADKEIYKEAKITRGRENMI